MLSVEPRGGDCGNEELGAVSIGTCVGHGKQSGLGMFFVEVLILEFFSVDGLASGSVEVGEVSALEHELRNDSVEDGVQIAVSFLSSAQCPEVLSCLWDNFVVEEEADSTEGGDLFLFLPYFINNLSDSGSVKEAPGHANNYISNLI